MPQLGLGLGLNKNSSPMALMPKDVAGNVLSLIANKANKGQLPTSATKTFSDMSKIRNSINYSNLLINNNFVDTSRWEMVDGGSNGFSWSVSNNEAIITNLGTNVASYKLYENDDFVAIAGRKYYCTEWMLSNSSSDGLLILTTGTQTSKLHTGNGTYQRLSQIHTCATTGALDFRALSTVRTGDISANPVKIKEPIIVDLTALGLDHLSVAQCDELFSFTTLGVSATKTRYNSQDWAQWTKTASAGSSIVANSSGITLNVYDAYTAITISTACKVSTKYGFLLNVPSNNLTYDLINDSSNAFTAGSIMVPIGFTGMRKIVLTSLATIATNIITFKRNNNEASLKSITLKDIRLFELPTGSQIETDFTNLTADELNILYPMGYGEAVATMPNDCTLNNIGSTVTSGFNKVAVVNGKGDSVSYTNILVNPDYATDTTGWTATNVTGSVTAGILTSTATAQFGSYNQSVTNKNGNRYFCKSNFKADSTNAKLYCGGQAVSHIGDSQFHTYSVLSTIPDATSWTIGAVRDYKASAWTPIYIDWIMVIDLTANTYVQALEAKLGRVLTVDECDRLFAFTATSNSVVIDTQYALSLDGTDDYGAFMNTPSLDITTNEFALACTFRLATGAGATLLLARNYDSSSVAQYGILYSGGAILITLNGSGRTTGITISENTWYNIIFYRNSSGVITPYLNKVSQPTATYATILTSQPYSRLGGRSNNTTGTAHIAYSKGDIATQNIYQAPTLDINKIIKAETNLAKLYTGVS